MDCGELLKEKNDKLLCLLMQHMSIENLIKYKKSEIAFPYR